MNLSNLRRRIQTPCLAVAAVLLLAAAAAACPTCKESIPGTDPNSANLARGYGYSILFMLSAPYVIFGSLAAYFYWQIRKAKAQQAWENGAEHASSLPVS